MWASVRAFARCGYLIDSIRVGQEVRDGGSVSLQVALQIVAFSAILSTF
jgi:hypothetical protein